MITTAEILDVALAYAEMGYRVLPCRGKIPATPRGCKDATTDPVQIRQWWVEGGPRFNIGIATDGLWVVDDDGEGWPHDADRILSLHDVPMVGTPRGGAHWYFRATPDACRSSTKKLGPQVDTRGRGGYVIAPPSTGGKYKWARTPGLIPMADLPEPPDWLLSLARSCGLGERKPDPTPEPQREPSGSTVDAGSRNAYLTSVAGRMRRYGASEEDLVQLISARNQTACNPPLPDAEVRKICRSIAQYPPAGGQDPPPPEGEILQPMTLGELIDSYPRLREPVIHGLLRSGEIMNLVAAPKSYKSWAIADLALAVATGREWFGLGCEQGEVLLIDNEMHPESLAKRIPQVAEARGIPLAEVRDVLRVQPLRGKLRCLRGMGPYLEQFEPGRFKLVILDAFYRFLPANADENSNAGMTSLYNQLDRYADRLQSPICLIHHTSKGSQASKGVTDVGSGAGAQSRATDSHLILRRHAEKDCAVLDCALRSWPPREPICIRWEWPLWSLAPELDPEDLWHPSMDHAGGRGEDEEPWDAERLSRDIVDATPRSTETILEQARDHGLGEARARRLLVVAEEAGLIHRWVEHRRIKYATQPPPPSDLEIYIREHPQESCQSIAKKFGVSRNKVRNLI